MNTEFFERWLKKKKISGIVTNCFLGVLSLAGGIIVLRSELAALKET